MSLNFGRLFSIPLGVALLAFTVAAKAEMLPGTAVVKSVRGAASYVDQFGGFHPLTEGTVLKEGSTVKTGFSGSVDLVMESNGRFLSVQQNSVLTFTKLSYQPSPLGNIFDTELNLKQGSVFASVSKLLAGARYELRTPQGVAKVRGTEFYYDAMSGQLWVVNGVVHFAVTLLDVEVPDPSNPQDLKRTIDVQAGQRLLIPRQIDINNFAAIKAFPYSGALPPPGLQALINAGSPFAGHYNNPGNTSVTVKEGWFTKLDPKANTVDLIGIPALVVPSP